MLLLHDMLDSVTQQHILALNEKSQLPERLDMQQDLGVTDRASSEEHRLIRDVGKICIVYILPIILLPLMSQLQIKA